MNLIDRPLILRHLGRLGRNFTRPKEWKTDADLNAVADDWVGALSDVSPKALEIAIDDVLKTEKYFPRLAVVRATALATDRELAPKRAPEHTLSPPDTPPTCPRCNTTYDVRSFPSMHRNADDVQRIICECERRMKLLYSDPANLDRWSEEGDPQSRDELNRRQRKVPIREWLTNRREPAGREADTMPARVTALQMGRQFFTLPGKTEADIEAKRALLREGFRSSAIMQPTPVEAT